MADNVSIDPGTTTPIATDDVAGVHIQVVKLATGEADSAERLGDTDKGTYRALWVDPRPSVVRLSATPTISTSAYAAKDAVGGLMTFANAARVAGGSVRIETVQVVDKDQEMKDLDLVLFDRSITAPTDNAVFDPTDAELANVIDVVPITAWADFNDNAVCSVPVGTAAVLNGTDLYGVLVARGTPTYTSTSDLIVTVTVDQG